MHPLRNLMFLVGRFLIAGVFIFDAFLMVRAWDSTAAQIASIGLPGQLVAAAALGQFVGGIMIVVGLWTRLAAFGLAAFCMATAVLFHRNLGSNSEMIQAGKDLAIAGGLLFLAATGPGGWSVDNRRRPMI
jgi:putative oxidoreductase